MSFTASDNRYASSCVPAHRPSLVSGRYRFPISQTTLSRRRLMCHVQSACAMLRGLTEVQVSRTNTVGAKSTGEGTEARVAVCATRTSVKVNKSSVQPANEENRHL